MTGSRHPAQLRPGVRRQRSSTWDRTGRNDDFTSLAPGETVVLAADDGPGQVTHLWFTVLTADLWWGRSLVLRAYWDGAATPSVEAPLGDLLGSGNCLTSTYSATWIEAAPRDGLSLHSWFPMPYADGFRITLTNEGPLPVPRLYCYVDYERWPSPDPELGRFHAWWNRRRPAPRTGPAGTYAPGRNLTGEDNYVLLATEGRGTYVGACLYVHSDTGGWYGEGDDMTFIDGETWPPSLHGTGTEDYFGTAWSPATEFSHPTYGQPVAQREDWAGFSSLYRLHVHDPVPFERSIRMTLEQGHANDRSDDWASVAYWYQLDRQAPLPALPPLSDREPPWPAAWRDRVLAVRDLYAQAEVDGRFGTGIAYLTRAAHRWDADGFDRALEWLGAGRSASTPQPGPVGPLRALAEASPEAVQTWVAGRASEAVLDVVAEDLAARFDAEQAGTAALTLGLRLRDEPAARQLTVAGGRCTVGDTDGPERLTLTADALTWVCWAVGQLDPWEAVLRGRLSIAGDGDLAVRLAGLFPPYVTTVRP